MAHDDELKTLKVSSAAFQESGGTEEFLEIWGRKILRMEMEPAAEAPLEIDLTLRCLPDLAMASGTVSPMQNRHTQELVDNDDIVLVVIQEGTGEVAQYGRVEAIKAGEAVLTANGSAGTFTGLTATRLINFRLSRSLIEQFVSDVDEFVARPIASDNRALQLLVSYASVLEDQKELETPELRHLVSMHMHDLAALLIGASRDARELAKTRSVGAARLRAIKASILENLSRQNLSIGRIALRNGITPRYVNILFESEGISFSEFVLDQRLTRVHRMLNDPGFDGRNISSIAFEIGFSDLSYFNRTFRRRFGMTPSEARAQSKKRR